MEWLFVLEIILLGLLVWAIIEYWEIVFGSLAILGILYAVFYVLKRNDLYKRIWYWIVEKVSWLLRIIFYILFQLLKTVFQLSKCGISNGAKWLFYVIKHGGIANYRAAILKKEQQKIAEEIRQRELAEAKRLQKEREEWERLENERKIREEKEREEWERLENERKIREEKESRALSDLDKIKLREFMIEKVKYLREKLFKPFLGGEFYGKVDHKAFNIYDSPYARIECTLEMWGRSVPFCVDFIFESILNAKISRDSISVSTWSELEVILREYLSLAFPGCNDALRVASMGQDIKKLVREADNFLFVNQKDWSQRNTGSKENPLSFKDEIKLRNEAEFRRKELNDLFAKFERDEYIPFHIVNVDYTCFNSYTSPYAYIRGVINIHNSPLNIVIDFTNDAILTAKIGNDSLPHDWDKLVKRLSEYLEYGLKEQQQKIRSRILEEEKQQAEAEKKSILKEKKLDAFGQLELKSVAHNFRRSINELLEDFKRKERVEEGNVTIDGTAFNEFEEPYAKILLRLKLIGSIYNFEMYMDKSEKILRVTMNNELVQVKTQDDLIQYIHELLKRANAAGVDADEDDCNHSALCTIGYLDNFDTHLSELADLAGLKWVDVTALDSNIKKQRNGGLLFYDKGNRRCLEEKATQLVLKTGLKEKNSKRPIFAKFWRGTTRWIGVRFVTNRPYPVKRQTNNKIGVWIGHDDMGDQWRQEQNDVATIVRDIKEHVERGSIDWCHILYNFKVYTPDAEIKTRQVDLALIMKNRILLIELKHYNNPVYGNAKIRWYSNDAKTGKRFVVKAGNEKIKNPFEQVKLTRKKVIEVLQSSEVFQEMKKKDVQKLVSAAVIFSDDLKNGQEDHIEVDTSSQNKWFYCGRISESIDLLRRTIPLKTNDDNYGIGTSKKAVDVITKVLGLQRADLAQDVPVQIRYDANM